MGKMSQLGMLDLVPRSKHGDAINSPFLKYQVPNCIAALNRMVRVNNWQITRGNCKKLFSDSWGTRPIKVTVRLLRASHFMTDSHSLYFFTTAQLLRVLRRHTQTSLTILNARRKLAQENSRFYDKNCCCYYVIIIIRIMHTY